MGIGCVDEFLSLCDAEAVLLVYNDECKAFELNVFLYDCMGADDDCQFAGGNPFFQLGF